MDIVTAGLNQSGKQDARVNRKHFNYGRQLFVFWPEPAEE